MKHITGIWGSYWVEADGVFKSLGEKKVSFLGKGMHKLGFAKLRSKSSKVSIASRGKKEYV